MNRAPAPGAVLDAIAFADAQHGWAAGPGTILGTDDGGVRWSVQYAGTARVAGLDVVDTAHAWAVASSALLGTTDGGSRWQVLGEPPGATLSAVDFVSPTVGFGATSAGLLVRSRDGGRTWAPLAPLAITGPPGGGGAQGATPASGPSPNSPAGTGAGQPAIASSVCFTSAQDGWAGVHPAAGSGGNPLGEVLRTTDGGQTWSPSFRPAPAQAGGRESVEQLGCTATTAWVQLGGDAGMMQHAYSIFRTADGGASWAPLLTINTAGAGPGPGRTEGAATGPGSSPGPLVVVSAADAYFFGECEPCAGAGTLQPAATTDGGRTWTTAPVVAGAWLFGSRGHPAAAFVAGGHGWLVATLDATHSAIFATANGGRTWAQQYPSAALQPLVAVDFLTAADGFGLGTPGDGAAILHTADGGRIWRRISELPLPRGASGGLSISFSDAEHGWAVAGPGALLATVDGGQHWAPVALPAGGSAFAGAALGLSTLLSPQVGCVYSPTPVAPPLCTTDGGRSWQAAARGRESLWTAGATLLRLPLAAMLADRYPAIATPIVGRATGPHSFWMADYLALYTTGDSGASWTRFTWPKGDAGPALAISFANAQDGWMLDDGLLATTDGGAVWAQLGPP